MTTATIQTNREISEMLKALAHPVRLNILWLLNRAQERKLTVSEIHETLNLTQPETSRHLSLMRLKGLLDFKKDGAMTYYFINTSNHLCKSLTSCICSLDI